MTEQTELPPEAPGDDEGQRMLVIQAVRNVLTAIENAPLDVPVSFMQNPMIEEVVQNGYASLKQTGVGFVIQLGVHRDVGFRRKEDRPPAPSPLLGLNGSPLVAGDL